MTKIICLVTFMTLILNSCGFHKDAPLEDKTFSTNSIEASCKLNTGEFEQLLDKDIEYQLKCLEENLLLYSSILRADTGGIIREGELQNFILRFFGENGREIIKGLSVFFQINTLILRERRNQIPKEKLKNLIGLLIKANKELIVISKIIKNFKDKSDLTYWEKRKNFAQAVRRLSDYSLRVLKETPGEDTKVNIRSLLSNVLSKFPGSKIDEEMYDTIAFTKHLVLSGDRNTITSSELEELLEKAPELMVLAFDLIFFTEDVLSSEIKRLDFIKKRIEDFRTLIHVHNPNLMAFSKKQLDYFIKKIVPGVNQKKIITMSRHFMSDFLGNDTDEFKYKDIDLFFVYSQAIIDGWVFKIQYQRTLDNKALTNKEKIKDLEGYFNKLIDKLKNTVSLKKLPESIKYYHFLDQLNKVLGTNLVTKEMLSLLHTFKPFFFLGDSESIHKNEIASILDKAPSLFTEYLNYMLVAPTLVDADLTSFSKFYVTRIQTIIDLKNPKYSGAISNEDVYNILSFTQLTPANKQGLVDLLEYAVQNIFSQEMTIYQNDQIEKILQYSKIGFLFFEIKDLIVSSNTDVNILNFEAKKELFLTVAPKVSNIINLLTNKVGLNFHQQVNFIKILELVQSAFSEFDMKIPTIKKTLPIKTLFVGGLKDQISIFELNYFKKKLYGLFDSAFELFHMKHWPKRSDVETSYQHLKIAKNFRKALYPGDLSNNFISTKELLETIDTILPGHKVIRFKSTLDQLLKKVVDKRSSVGQVSLRSIFTIFDWAVSLTEQRYFNDVTLKHFPNLFRFNIRYTRIPNIDLPEYEIFTQTRLGELRSKLSYIVKRFRFFRDKKTQVSRYGREFRRTAYGFSELTTLRFVLEKIVGGYGHLNYNTKQYEFSVEEVDKCLKDFKSILEVFNLWSKQMATFAENTTLLGDLFQSISDGNGAISIDEGTEYFSLVLMAIQMSYNYRQELTKVCKTSQYHSPLVSFPVACHEKNFFNTLLNKNGYAKALPRLNEYISSLKPDEQVAFLRNVQGFARDYTGAIPINERELTLLIGALINIESTLIRFDKDGNNYIDEKELEKAFGIYRSSIIKVAKLEPSKYKYAKTIFFYMVKEMEIPSKADILYYHYIFNNNPLSDKKIRGERLNIGALLYYIVKQR